MCDDLAPTRAAATTLGAVSASLHRRVSGCEQVQVLRDAKQEVPPELLRLAAEGRAARYKRYKYS